MAYNNQNTTVLSLSELRNIQDRCSLNNQRDNDIRQKAREELKQKSNARAANWPNTISAL